MQKQNINLYQVEIKPEKFDFRALQMLQLLCLFGIGLFLVTSFEAIKHFTRSRNLTELQKQKMAVTQTLKITEAKVPSALKRETMLKQIKVLEEEQQVKQEVLNTLINLQVTQTDGFSKYFKALALHTAKGIWLTEFYFNGKESAVSLEGKTLNPEYVPMLMNNLSRAPEFSGKTFKVFKLGVDKKTQEVSFSLESSPAVFAAEPETK